MARDSSRRDHDRQPRDRDTYRNRDRERERQRRRRGHRATDSTGELLPQAPRTPRDTSTSESPNRRKAKASDRTSGGSSNPLSLDSLAKLDQLNQKKGWKGYDYDSEYVKEVRRKEERLEKERVREEEREKRRMREEEREKRRAYESDYAREEQRRVKKERAVGEKNRRHTDDEREDRRRYEERYTESERKERRERRKAEAAQREAASDKKMRRVISGPLLEEGGNKEVHEYIAEKRGGAGSGSSDGYTDEEWARRKRKRICIIFGIVVLILAIVIPVAIVVSKKNSSSTTPQSNASANTQKPSNSELNGISESSIPATAKGTILDPFTWYDTTDFNVTYTDAVVGGLTIMGLNSTWDDSVQANPNVPALKDSFDYGTMPIRGMNVGGWLSIEPFITPSFFSGFSTHDNVIDEYTLTSKLGSTKATQTIESHYSAFVNRQTFEDIRAAGFDHVRIPFSYWAVTTYDGDPYIPKISWRYLLRGIEYCRQNGLRVNLDLHALPGSQNGWNHSGRQGVIGWLNGTDGDLNAQRSLDIHNQLSTFFAQDRYKNIVTMYGLVNEPRMVALNTDAVLNWTSKAIDLIRKNNITAVLVFGDGFMGLDNWQGKLQNYDNLLLDVHQYVIFNTDQIKLKHTDKLNFACKGWTAQTLRSEDKTTGFGPTMCGEWSQADTDCTQYINDVGVGSRWEGTMNTGNASTSVLSPTCPTNNNPTCECTDANADPSKYTAVYKQWLLQFAQAQMESFERGWGWFYWTWETEAATQWSWKLGMAAGILPAHAYDRNFNCNDTLPDYGQLGLPENY
ncbi:glycoside hydrolase family 5 protein [Lepidopterella palustris CBS 459.81]|uniref:glucan 1,3-beta-glucosidase n=1 Tax=Lepidopterella palustris CBS 459.81 TaxID=1314670 RepID=A0A8E2JJA1_9PEZI|nr:glycoside hydrolase family 5 protein [Lepidopterella palustris CBS 459.81]